MDTSREAVAERLAHFRRRCAELGVALTPQRLAIYQLLARDDSHPSAEDIYRHVKPSLPSLSLGTVYRTLDLFEARGLVSRIHPLSQQARFDANLEEHHHFVCVRCRRVLDCEDQRLEEVPVQAAAPRGFRVLRHAIQVFGVCQACQGGT
jgi:Fur family peroxide stress response transcriptional regulator